MIGFAVLIVILLTLFVFIKMFIALVNTESNIFFKLIMFVISLILSGIVGFGACFLAFVIIAFFSF